MREDFIISIIVPVFNTGCFLPRCLESLLNQTYQNLDIIVVDDGSTENIVDIITKYIERDSRIRYIKHESNMGLFQARLTGTLEAQGDYIAFLDSDDFASTDLYRMLLSKALQENADLVFSKYILFDETNSKQLVTPFNNPTDEILVGSDVFKHYMCMGRYQNYWPIVWNKLIKKELWNRAYPHFLTVDQKLISFEDVVFSTVLLSLSNTVTFIDYKGVYYSKNDKASTSLSKSKEKIKRNICHIGYAMRIVKEFLIQNDLYETYKSDYDEWLKRESCLWIWAVRNEFFNACIRHRFYNLIRHEFGDYPFERQKLSLYNIMYSCAMPYEASQDTIRNEIIQHEYIAFDLFDCLLTLPLLSTQDLPDLLDLFLPPGDPDHQISSLRNAAECLLNERCSLKGENSMLPGIDDIYDMLSNEYHLDEQTISEASSLEKRLYVDLSSVRRPIFCLYELAKHLNKKIIITTDTTLDKNSVAMLLKEKKIDYSFLFIERELNTGCTNASIQNKLAEQLDIQCDEIFYIYSKNHFNPSASSHQDTNTFRISPCAELLLNQNKHKRTSSLTSSIIENASSIHWSEHRSSLEYRSLTYVLGIISNRLFENPFEEYAENSDFNGQPFWIGYYAVGMMVLGAMKWLLEICARENVDTVVFFPKHNQTFRFVFDLLARQYHFDIQSTNNGQNTKNEILFSVEANEALPNNYCIYSCHKKVECDNIYYRRKPIVTGELREKFTDSYAYNGNIDEYTHSEIIKGIQCLASDVCTTFREAFINFSFRQEDCTAAFDKLLISPSRIDKKLFSESTLSCGRMVFNWGDDSQTYGNGTNVNYSDMPDFFVASPKWKKAIFCLFFNQDFLMEKAKGRFNNNPIILGALDTFYKLFKTVSRKAD